MKNIHRSLIIGIIAGAIDVIPMIFQGLCWYANTSAFIFWVGMGLIIPSINWELKGWRKGFIVAELLALPVIIIVAKTDIKSIIPIFIMTAILGSLVGHYSNRYIKRA
jgi:hypothetical protein